MWELLFSETVHVTSAESDREEFIREFTQLISELPIRETARRSGWSKSTVSELRLGQRLPNRDQLEHFLTVAGIDADGIDQWQQRLLAIAPRTASQGGTTVGETASSATPSTPPATSQRPRRRQVLNVVLVTAVAIALVGTGFLVGRLTAAPGVATSPTPFVAKIANTANLGVDLYTGPSRIHSKAGALAEGIAIRVVCQDGGGEVVTDRVAGRRIAWPVWDRLADGFWVPDIYTSTNKAYRPGPGRTALISC